MPQLNLNAGTNQVRSTAQASLGTATTLAFKLRVSGAFLRSGPATPGFANLLYTGGDTAGRLNAFINTDGANTNLYVLFPPGGPIAQIIVATASIDPGTMYVVYGHLSPTGCVAEIYEDDGTVIGSASGAGATIPNNGAANGTVRLGQTSVNGAVGLVDGLAIYSATLAGAARYSEPAASDANILDLWFFEEGTGTTAANAVSGRAALGSAMWVGATWQVGGTWDAATPPPTLTAGVATLGTVNGYLVQASATAATGGVAPITQQWQRSPRGAGTWSNVAGATGLSMRDTSVAASTNYDYRVESTDGAAQVVYSNTIQPNVPAATPVWGAMGDSNTDEYRADDNRSGSTAFAATTLNWLELLVNHRSLNFGAWSDTSRGSPRREGYEYNWALSGVQIGSVAGAQLTGILAQIQAGTVTHVAIQGTVNEWHLASGRVDDIYNSPDGGITGGTSGDLVADMVSDYADAINGVVDQLLAAGAAGVVVLTNPDYIEYPGFEAAYTNATQRGYYTAAVEGVFTSCDSHATSVNATYGYNVVEVVRWDAEYITDLFPTYVPGSPGTLDVGGETILVAQASNGDPHYFYENSGHAGTVLGGFIANSFVGAANTLDGIAITPFSDSEILTNAGITASGITGDGAVTLPALTASGAGVVAIVGTGAATLPAITATGAGSVAVQGAGSVTLPSLAAAGAGSVAVQGAGSTTLPALTASGAGAVAIQGAGAVTLPLLVASGSTSQTTTGDGAVTLPALTASGSGVVEVQAAGVVTLPALSAGGTATVLVQGDGNASLPALTVTATGVVAIQGAGAVTLPLLIVSGAEIEEFPGSDTGGVVLRLSGGPAVRLQTSGAPAVKLRLSGGSA